MLKDMRYQSNQNPEVSDIPSDVEIRLLDNAHDLVTDAILDERPEILSNYFDLTLTGATSYFIPDYIKFNYEQILMIEDITNSDSPVSTAPSNWFDRMQYFQENINAKRIAWNIRDQYIEFPNAADLTASTLRVWYVRRPVGFFYGTVAAGAASTVTFPTTPTAGEVILSNDYYNGMQVYINGDVRWITDYVGSTRVATVNAAWTAVPTTANTVELMSPLPDRLHSLIVNVAAKLVKIANDDDISLIENFIKDQLARFIKRLNKPQIQEAEVIRKVPR